MDAPVNVDESLAIEQAQAHRDVDGVLREHAPVEVEPFEAEVDRGRKKLNRDGVTVGVDDLRRPLVDTADPCGGRRGVEQLWQSVGADVTDEDGGRLAAVADPI